MKSAAVIAGLVGVLSFSLPAMGKGSMHRSGALKSLSSCAEFASHEEIGVFLSDLEEAYPDILRLFSIGTSVLGRTLYAVRISANPDEETAEPEIRIIGAIHGNECIGAKEVLNVIEWLTSGYGSDPIATELVDNTEIVLVPLVNPDGYSAPFAHRENANGVDLNYNLHFAWINVGTHPFSEPETQAIRNLSQDNSFNVGISYHTKFDYINAPWNYSPHHPPEEAIIQEMGEAYAGDSRYRVTFGWDWYNIQGDVNDWSLGTQGTFDWTIELRSDTEDEWDVHRAGLGEMFAYVFGGITGRVVAEETGEPLAARLRVLPEGSPIFTDPDMGDYHRLILPGTFSIMAEAPGYEPQIVKGVVVEDGDGHARTTVDFSLRKDRSSAPIPAFAVNGMTLPQAVSTQSYDVKTYPNSTMVWSALGESDGVFYSMSPKGNLTLDMGQESLVADEEGLDLRIVSGTESDDPVAVTVAESQDGPFVEIGEGEGTFELDIADSGFKHIRYVRLIDRGESEFTAEFPGYDVDAVLNIAVPPPKVEIDTDTTQPLWDGGDDADGGVDAGPGQDTGKTHDGSEKMRAVSGDSTYSCRQAAMPEGRGIIDVIVAVF